MEPRAAPPLQFFHPFTLLSFLLRINGLCLQCFSFSQIRSNLEHFGSSKSYVIHRFPRRFPIFGDGAQPPSLFLDVVQFFRFFCFRSFYLSQKRRGGGFFIFFIPLLATSYNFQPLFYILNHNFRFVKSFFQKNKKLHKKIFRPRRAENPSPGTAELHLPLHTKKGSPKDRAFKDPSDSVMIFFVSLQSYKRRKQRQKRSAAPPERPKRPPTRPH